MFAEAAKALPRRHQCVLQGIFCVLYRSQHAVAVHMQLAAVRLGQRSKCLPVTGPRPRESGTYVVSADRITFTVDQGDPNCLGLRRTARWALHGESSLSFTGISSTAPPTCGPQTINDAWARMVFELHPWQRAS